MQQIVSPAERGAASPAEIRVLTIAQYKGPSSWSDQPVVHLGIDCGPAADDIAMQLRAAMAASGFQTADGAGVNDVGTLVVGISFEMQRFAGDEVTFSASHPAGEPGRFDVVLGYQQPELAIATVGLAVRMLNVILSGDEPGFDFEREFEQRVLSIVQRRPLLVQERAMAAVARRRGIPFRAIEPTGKLIELGTGKYLRRYRGMIASTSGHLGSSISNNKTLTKQILRELGLPAPEGDIAGSVDEAIAAAERIGYPVVLKPLNAGQGRGLGVDLGSAEKVRQFFPVAAGVGRMRKVIVEKFIPGNEYRILVIGDSVAAVCQRVPAHVTGDGVHTIEELIDIANSDPLRGAAHMNILNWITINEATVDALERAGLTLEDVPADGQQVKVKLASNVSQGGTSIDRTEEIHPENARLACLAAKAIGVDLCGVDLLTSDISRPIWEVGGAFIELNYEPGPTLHLHPQEGKPRDLGSAVLDWFYPEGSPVRVPVVAVSGSADAEETSALIARFVREPGRTVGLATSCGTEIDGVPLGQTGDSGTPQHQSVLRNPDVEFAVLQIDAADVERRGLDFDLCDLLVITGPNDDEMSGPRSLEEVLFGTVVAGGTVVFDAADPRIDDLLRKAPERTILFSADATDPRVAARLAGGGRAVVVDDGSVVLANGSDRVPVAEVGRLSPMSDGGGIESVLAAIAAAWALDVPVERMRQMLGEA